MQLTRKHRGRKHEKDAGLKRAGSGLKTQTQAGVSVLKIDTRSHHQMERSGWFDRGVLSLRCLPMSTVRDLIY